MKKIIKLALVLITSFSLGFSANAGDLTVSGTAKATYNIQSSDGGSGNDLGKGLGVTNELSFKGSGELDNGWTWGLMIALDPNAVAADNAAAQNDDTTLTLTTPYGTVGAFISAGGLDTTFAYSAAAYKVGADLGTGAVLNPVDLGDYNSLQYHSPAGLLPFGTVFKVGYAPSAAKGAGASGDAAGTANTLVNTFTTTTIAGAADSLADWAPDAVSDVTEYSVVTSPIDGLTVSASYIDIDSTIVDATAQGYEAGAVNAKYAYGPVTVGYGRTLVQPYVASGTEVTVERALYTENTAISVGFAVNENLSVSYETIDSDTKIRATGHTGVDTNTTNSQSSDSIQAAYTMGGMTLAISQQTTDGDGYTKEEAAASRNDVKETIFAVTMAF
jgi:outer membrane protein OmpU